MYTILLTRKGSKYNQRRVRYDSFKSIKKDVIKQLDSNGWSNKDSVDLRSILSCLEYLYPDKDIIIIKRCGVRFVLV